MMNLERRRRLLSGGKLCRRKRKPSSCLARESVTWKTPFTGSLDDAEAQFYEHGAAFFVLDDAAAAAAGHSR